MKAYDQNDAVERERFDYLPLLLAPLLAVFGLALVRDVSTWMTLTIAGVGMGFIFFLVASGLTVVFGLMGVMNFAHGIFVTLGAVVGGIVLYPTVMPLVSCWCRADSLWMNLMGLFVAAVIGMVAVTIVGAIFERLVMREAYGKPLIMQIMLTVGGMIIVEELMKIYVGRGMVIRIPTSLAGVMVFGNAAIEKYRLMTFVLGSMIYLAMMILFNRTKVGMLVRASVEQREMVEAMGYRVKFLFIGVFLAGVALAGLGGLLFGMFQGLVKAKMGSDLMTPIFMILIIGGVGSITGSCVAAILIGLLTNYIAYVFPPMTGFATIFLMFAIALWRPDGLYPVLTR